MENPEEIEQGQKPAEIDESAAAAAFEKQQEMIAKQQSRIKELEAAKATYYDKVINGNVVQPEIAQPLPSVKDCREKLLKVVQSGGTNLDYVKASLELNKACEREQGISCFLPQGKDISPTADEVQTAQKFVAVMEECVEIADGDPAVFNNELMRRSKSQAANNNKRR